MNWDAIGAIGEILGALAVVLTLGYLAIQVKQNTHSMKVAAKLERVITDSDNNKFHGRTLGKSTISALSFDNAGTI